MSAELPAANGSLLYQCLNAEANARKKAKQNDADSQQHHPQLVCRKSYVAFDVVRWPLKLAVYVSSCAFVGIVGGPMIAHSVFKEYIETSTYLENRPLLAECASLAVMPLMVLVVPASVVLLPSAMIRGQVRVMSETFYDQIMD